MIERPDSQIRDLDLRDVEVDDGFWMPRQRTAWETTVWHGFDQLFEERREQYVDNFLKAAGRLNGRFQGNYWNNNDAQTYKLIEAASHTLAVNTNPELKERVDELISIISDAQEEDGYLNTYFSIEEPDMRWTNLGVMHELYCAGHLFMAAVAHYKVTGEEDLLDIARDFADHIDDVFGPEDNLGYAEHPKVELGLVDLYRATGEDRYLDLVQFFIDRRGTEPNPIEAEMRQVQNGRLDNLAGGLNDNAYETLLGHHEGGEGDVEGEQYDGTYSQDHRPIREQREIHGHAVRAMYLYSAVTDLLMERDDTDLYEALERIWQNMVERRMYITGGLGSTYTGERFSADYHLPNDAYAETCAAFGSILWNHRMLQVTRKSRFADELERVLYNGFLSGVSLPGNEFFYVNPLVADETHRRQEWFDCACCPPNVARLLASLQRYIYLQDQENVFVNLYIGSEMETSFDGANVVIDQESGLPWNGDVRLEVNVSEPIDFTVNLRVPSWSSQEDISLAVNGEEPNPDVITEEGYVKLDRSWSDGDRIELSLPLSIKLMEAHPAVEDDRGLVAIRRGPLVYCLEEVDNEVDLDRLRLPEDSELKVRLESDFKDGHELYVIEGKGQVRDPTSWGGSLYQPTEKVSSREVTFKAIPYYAWAHRNPGHMRVWIRSNAA